MQMSHKISGVTRPKFTKVLAIGIFSSTVLTQQSALRSVHPSPNDRGDIKKESRLTEAKYIPAGSIAMPGGLIIINKIQHLSDESMSNSFFGKRWSK